MSRQKEMEELFGLLRADGWEPMLCDTNIKEYDNAVNCGCPEDVGDITCQERPYPHEMLPGNMIYRVPAKGDSMLDAGIETGDMLTIETDVSVRDDDLIMVCIDGQFTVKAYHEDDQGGKWLVPFNEKYEPIKISEENRVYISGKVIEVAKCHPRVRHRDTMRFFNMHRQESVSRELSVEELKGVIVQLADEVTFGRLWFAVYRAMTQFKYMEKGYYDAFCRLVAEAVPRHGHLPKAQEMQRMDTQSFSKMVVQWNEQNAPVKGSRYRTYKRLAEKTIALLTA